MDLKYQELLILSYFKSHYKKYEFNELFIIMGMTYSELQDTIDRLLEMNYLMSYNYYILLTKKGENILNDKRLEDFFSKKVKDTKSKEQWDISKPYIPIGFKI